VLLEKNILFLASNPILHPAQNVQQRISTCFEMRCFAYDIYQETYPDCHIAINLDVQPHPP